MIVKSGRLYLWQNNISEKELVVKVGTGSSENQYVEIDQTELVEEIADTEIKVATESSYEQWVIDGLEDNWSDSIIDINNYIFVDERKIVIYVKIKSSQAGSFEFGEIGLFVKNSEIDENLEEPIISYVMISRNLLHKQYISDTEPKIIKYTINI